MSPDGRTVAIRHPGFTYAKVLDATTLAEIATLRGHDQEVRDVAFSPNGEILATTAATGDKRAELILWDARTLVRRKDIREKAHLVCSLAFSPDSSTLASGTREDTIHLWNIHTGQLRARLLGHAYRVLTLSFSPDGRLLASGGTDGKVRLWDVSSLRDPAPRR